MDTKTKGHLFSLSSNIPERANQDSVNLLIRELA
jgi:hypothetical protein